MKPIIIQLVANIPSVLCVTIAGIMAVKEKEGWGWFLLIACLLFTTLKKIE